MAFPPLPETVSCSADAYLKQLTKVKALNSCLEFNFMIGNRANKVLVCPSLHYGKLLIYTSKLRLRRKVLSREVLKKEVEVPPVLDPSREGAKKEVRLQVAPLIGKQG